MRHVIRRCLLVLGLAIAGWIGDSATAEAVIGRPATPVSYAGVARRSTVGVGAVGVGVTPGVGVGARGVGVAPGVGLGAPGVGAGLAPANLGGPVNRVGWR